MDLEPMERSRQASTPDAEDMKTSRHSAAKLPEKGSESIRFVDRIQGECKGGQRRGRVGQNKSVGIPSSSTLLSLSMSTLSDSRMDLHSGARSAAHAASSARVYEAMCAAAFDIGDRD